MPQTTNRELFSYHDEILSWKGSVMAVLLRGRIKTFYDNNGLRINTLVNKYDKLREKYFVLDEKGNQTFPPDDPKTPIMQEGMTNEQWLEECDELMNTPTVIKF